ncbi:MAG: AMP-binding protein, partial [Candidatus Hodarchaeota archaeon]
MIKIQTEQSPYDAKIWLKSYDKHVQPTLEYPKENLGKLFDNAMSRFPDRAACYFMKTEISFKELRDYVHRFATFLQENGLEKGDRVAINLPNCPQYMVAHFGTILAGGVASGCSPLLSPTELAYQINDSESKFFVTLDAIYAKVLIKILEKLPNLKCVITTNVSDYMGLGKPIVFLGKLIGKIPKGKVVPFPGKLVLDFKEVIKTAPNVKEVKIDIENDLALLQYTGGTTGLPKGTELTHKNLISNMTQIVTWIDTKVAKEGEVNLSAFPMFHLAGLQMSMTTLYTSGPQILIVNPRDTKHIIEEVIDKQPRLMVNVPTLYLSIKNNPLINKVPNTALDKLEVYVS